MKKYGSCLVSVLCATALILSVGLRDAAAAGSKIGKEGTSFSVGLEFNTFTYKEVDDDGSTFMKESGSLIGLNGTFTAWLSDQFVLKAFGSFASGDLKYEGGIQTSSGAMIPLELDTPNTIYNLLGTAGVKIPGEQFDFTPYAGLAWRLLIDELPSQYGYTREQTYIYLPVGCQVSFMTGSDWGIEARAEYDVFLSGENYSHGAALGGGITMQQDKGAGYSIAVAFNSPEFAFGQGGTASVTIEPFIQIWDIDKSKETDGFLEPKNDSSMYGLRGMLRF